MLGFDRFLDVHKIPRLCNSASHDIARFGMVNKRTQLWLGSVLDELRGPIQRDCNDSMIF
jgi:hypothetical protein